MNRRYPLAPFRVHSIDTLREIMRTWPLASVSSGAAGAAHIAFLPLLVPGDSSSELHLLGHLDANSGIAKLAQDTGAAEARLACEHLNARTDGSARPLLEPLLTETMEQDDG
jgi:hypothetical protein